MNSDHSAYQGLSFLLAACSLSEPEREYFSGKLKRTTRVETKKNVEHAKDKADEDLVKKITEALVPDQTQRRRQEIKSGTNVEVKLNVLDKTKIKGLEVQKFGPYLKNTAKTTKWNEELKSEAGTLSVLQEMLNINTKENPITEERSLKIHDKVARVKKEKSVVDVSKLRDKEAKCPTCGVHVRKLRQHYLNIHVTGSFPCKICKKMLTSSHSLSNHKFKHHRNKSVTETQDTMRSMRARVRGL